MDELTQLLINKKALKVIPWNQKDPTGETIPSFMLLKEKYDALGNFEKVKARLVCDGSKQATTETEISSPTAHLESIIKA